jgi:hypothetical protein
VNQCERTCQTDDRLKQGIFKNGSVRDVLDFSIFSGESWAVSFCSPVRASPLFGNVCYRRLWIHGPISEAQGDFEKRRGAGGLGFRDLLGRALGDDFSSSLTGFGAQVKDPVGFGSDGHVVLDDDDGVALVSEAVKDVDGALDMLKV